MQTNTHSTRALLPTSWNLLLRRKPRVASLFARLFLSAADLERQQAEKVLAEVEGKMETTVIPIKLPKLLFLQLIAIDGDSQTAGIERYLASSGENRCDSLAWLMCSAQQLGHRLRIGAYLWKCPDRGKKEVNSLLEYCLLNNLSYADYCRAEEFGIPELLQSSESVDWPSCPPEDLKWLELDEEELNELMHSEEGNIREKDIDGILEAEKAMSGEELLDSFKSFLNAISNVEGVDSMGEQQSEEICVDFDKVCQVLKGIGESDKSESSSEEEAMPMEPSVVDEEVLTNLMESYSLQETTDGPVSSILTSMGHQLPFKQRSFVCSKQRIQQKQLTCQRTCLPPPISMRSWRRSTQVPSAPPSFLQQRTSSTRWHRSPVPRSLRLVCHIRRTSLLPWLHPARCSCSPSAPPRWQPVPLLVLESVRPPHSL